MQFDVYCDESYPDLFCSKNPQGRFLVIGSLWFLTENRDQFKLEIHQIRDKHKMGHGEFKWNKVSESRFDFYKDVTEWFIHQGENLRFRCIVVDNDKINLVKFHNDDQELGFYKFYYQMLHQWIYDYNEYNIFCDYKTLSSKNRLDTLKNCLSNANRFALVNKVQPVHSDESVMLQLVDLLLGIASSKFNNSLKASSLKQNLVTSFESFLGKPIAPTNRDEKKFNVFKIDLRGGW